MSQRLSVKPQEDARRLRRVSECITYLTMNFAKPFSLSLLVSFSFLWAGCEAPPEAGGTGGQLAVDESFMDDADSGVPVEPAEWLTNYDEALALAAEEEKPVLINFTGSDWCPPCMRLKQEVFDDPVFHRYARENLVLLELDFPLRIELPRELVEQNRVLQQKYQIEGFPTLIVLDPAGKEQRRHVGFRPGGVRGFVGWVRG